MAPRDSQRKRLYDAERVLRTHVGSRVWDGQTPELRTVAQCQAYVTGQKVGGWHDDDGNVCALSAAALALRARRMI